MANLKQIYRPSMTVGQWYARPRGSGAALAEIGNVLEAVLSHEEDVQRQADMRNLGGGTYARVSRITQCNLELKIADWNPVNYTRSIFGTAAVVAAGSVSDVSYPGARQGGLVRLARPNPSAVTVKIASTTIAPSGNYEVRPGGIFVLDGAADIPDNSTLLITSTHPEHVNVEALTTTAPELEMCFVGLNEADSGKPVILDVFRVSSGVAKQLALLQTTIGTLDISSEVLVDPTKTGAGISRFYRAQLV